jgi:uncharacterized protein (DUF58 family)
MLDHYYYAYPSRVHCGAYNVYQCLLLLLLLLATLLISSGTSSSSSSSAVRVAEQLVVSSSLCKYSSKASEALVLHTSSSAGSLHSRSYPPQVLMVYARKQVVLNLKVEAIAQQCP